ncbi:hypothetical protein RFF05_02900 [Bengtsoniella intestinalis]|uniref:hypothetical protein n=1 Tax=Bengtsoniella intestinalis TaxID=3073143 RepID=UPI00391F97DC
MSYQIYDAITNLSDDLVDEAIATTLRRKMRWYQYTALAACLALVISVGSKLPLNTGMDSSSSSSTTTTTTTTESAPTLESESIVEDTATSIVYTSAQQETLTMTVVSWQDDGFCGTVVTGDESGLFPEGAELTIIVEGEEPYPDGTTVTVSFYSYEEYQADNDFDNRVYADNVEVN